MVAGIPARRPAERISFQFHAAHRLLPRFRPRHNGAANSDQCGIIGVPAAGCGKTASRLQVQVEPRQMHLLLGPAMREAYAHMGLVGALVRGKSGIAINTKQRTPRGMRVRHQPRADPMQWLAQVGNKPQAGIAHRLFIARLVGLEPLAVVVPLQLLQETEQLTTEVSLSDRTHHNPSTSPSLLTPDYRLLTTGFFNPLPSPCAPAWLAFPLLCSS